MASAVRMASSLPRSLMLAWASRAESLREASLKRLRPLCRKGFRSAPMNAPRRALAVIHPRFCLMAPCGKQICFPVLGGAYGEEPTMAQRTRTRQDQAQWQAQRDERMSTLLQQLEAGVEAIQTSEDFQRYLRTAAIFPHYRPNNTLLILTPYPVASCVAGYRTGAT